jgi:type IV pilus assembly protein PilM
MMSLSQLLERARGLDLERALGLRPDYPPVALALERGAAGLVRLRRRRRGRPLLEAYQVGELEPSSVPATIFQNDVGSIVDLSARLRTLFETTATRPGRVSLVLPDNLAKVSLLSLPEWPPSRKQLEQIIRFKMRRAVPFRLDDANLAYQLLEAEGKGLAVLVVLIRRSLLEHYEHALEAVGARVGLVDLCSTNLLNLCRDHVESAAKAGGDVALLNCTSHYFSLVIIRRGRLIFFRCKNYATGDEETGSANGTLARETASSLSYYHEKLAGERIGTMIVRSAHQSFDEIAGRLAGCGVERIEPVDTAASVELSQDSRLDPGVAQLIAPALGAAAARRN